MEGHPTLQMQKLRFGGVIQSHTASNWQNQNLNTVLSQNMSINADAFLPGCFWLRAMTFHSSFTLVAYFSYVSWPVLKQTNLKPMVLSIHSLQGIVLEFYFIPGLGSLLLYSHYLGK